MSKKLNHREGYVPEFSKSSNSSKKGNLIPYRFKNVTFVAISTLLAACGSETEIAPKHSPRVGPVAGPAQTLFRPLVNLQPFVSVNSSDFTPSLGSVRRLSGFDLLEWEGPSITPSDFLGLSSHSSESLRDLSLSWKRDPNSPNQRLNLVYGTLPVFGVEAVLAEGDGGYVQAYLSSNLPSWWDQVHRAGFYMDKGDSRYSVEWATQKISSLLGIHSTHLTLKARGWVATPNGLQCAQNFVSGISSSPDARSMPVPLEIFFNCYSGKIEHIRKLAFDFQGTAAVYRENAKSSETEGIIEVSLSELLNDGSALNAGYFKVLNCDKKIPSNSCSAQAKGPDFKKISFDNPQYDEVVAYYSIISAANWHKKVMNSGVFGGPLGEKWGNAKTTLGMSESQPLTAYVRAVTATADGGTTLDNAQYLPGGRTGVGSPEIIIGTGWEQNQGPQRPLIYLGRDSDVSMHEFGHHILFRTLKETSGQSGAMHEGFSDYFTYAQTGNSYLGESIVATGVSLRRGTIVGNVKNYLRSSPHKAGEYWSSVLVQVKDALGNWNSELKIADKVIWDSVDLLKENAGYYDAIAAMTRSLESFSSSNQLDAIALKEKMFTVFFENGFIDKPTGNGVLPKKSALLLGESESSSSSSSSSSSESGTDTVRKKKSTFSLCGVVGYTDVHFGYHNLIWLALGILFPLARKKRVK